MNTAKSQVNIWESKNDYSGLRKKIEMREKKFIDKVLEDEENNTPFIQFVMSQFLLHLLLIQLFL